MKTTTRNHLVYRLSKVNHPLCHCCNSLNCCCTQNHMTDTAANRNNCEYVIFNHYINFYVRKSTDSKAASINLS